MSDCICPNKSVINGQWWKTFVEVNFKKKSKNRSYPPQFKINSVLGVM